MRFEFPAPEKTEIWPDLTPHRESAALESHELYDRPAALGDPRYFVAAPLLGRKMLPGSETRSAGLSDVVDLSG